MIEAEVTGILDWPPILWTGRVVLLIVAVVALAACWAAILYLARFFRLSHVRAMLRGKLPTLSTFGGSVQLLGQKIEANATIDVQRDEQIETLNRRVANLEEQVRGMAGSVEYLLRREGHGEGERRGLREGVGSGEEGEGGVEADPGAPGPL